MRFRLAYAAPCLLLAAACGEIAPPLDQLPLRDTLRADPQVVAALDDGARQNLADRLLLMRGGEIGDDAVDDPAAPPAELVARLDRARERRGLDALVAGAIEGSSVVPARPEVTANQMPLPPLEIGPAPAPAPTLEIESRALAGRAGIELGALLARSGAHHLQRVVGWPIGAIAIGDRIYVNAAWLVALAPGQPGDAGADAGSANNSGARGAPAPDQVRAPSVAPSGQTPAPPPSDDGGVAIVSALSTYDGGIYTPPPQPPQPPPVSSGDDCSTACASSSSSSSSDDCGSSGGDDCSGTDDGSGGDCSGTGDGSGDDCSSASDSGSSCETSADEGEGCAIARSRRHQGKGTLLTLAMPLAFLLPRRRR